MKPLPVLGESTHRLMTELVASYGFAKKNRIVEEVCASLAGELRRTARDPSTCGGSPSA